VHDLPEKPNEAEKLRWAVQFNKRVMCARPVLEHLANCLGDHLDVLGKTLVFAADIDSAQTLTTLLKQHPKVGDGKVSLVHSRLDEFEEELEDLGAPQAADTQQQIDAFLKRGHKPCVMVNVGMLTTGFDDPAIQTVMLARLTFSPNLFWQMLGRGTRGPRITGGTDRCYVIDPIRLTKVFDHAAGYKPLERLFDEGEEKAPVDRAVVVGRSRRSEDARAIAEALEAFIRGHEESKPWDFAKAATRYRRVGDELRLLEEGEHPDDTMYREVIAELEEDLGSDMKWLLAPPFLNGFGVEEAETFARCVNKARRFRCSSAAALIAVLAT